MALGESLMPYEALIREAAKESGISFTLLLSIATQESSLRAHAYRFEPAFWERYLKNNPLYHASLPDRVSASYGLFQIMYPTAVDYGFHGEPEELFVPSTNVKFACKILADLLKWSNGDNQKALAAYNGGKGSWNTHQPLSYASQVLARQRKLDGTNLL